jgi:hypothetical protein
MDDDFYKEHGLMTPRELDEMGKRWERKEEEGLKNLLKHFDRIHDKLFTFNNILIAGYFALAKLTNTIASASILIPLGNLIILIWIEYRMMEKSRFESDLTKKSQSERDKWSKGIDRTNLYSLLAIVSTAIVTLLFLIYLI